MRSVTNSMGSVVKGMDKAMESMNLERVSGFCWFDCGSGVLLVMGDGISIEMVGRIEELKWEIGQR